MFYSVLRYNIIKGVPWEHLPLFIGNKAISFAAVVLIMISYLPWPACFQQKENARNARKWIGVGGFFLACVHSLGSVMLLHPEHYGLFFNDNGTLNFTGELSMLAGLLGFFFFGSIAVLSLPGMAARMGLEPWRRARRLGLYGLGAIGLHIFMRGYEGWLRPGGWPGYLPPISLLAFLGTLAALLAVLMRNRNGASSAKPEPQAERP